MMRKASTIIFILVILTMPAVLRASETNQEARLVTGIKALDPRIAAVRPASVHEPGRVRFPIVWMPAITLRAKTPIEAQLEILQKVSKFVVQFQGGVPTEDVLGGIIAFVEGEGWTPEIGQVFYQVDNPSGPSEVWVGLHIVDESGNVSCCEDAGRIGQITGRNFQPESTAKLLPTIKSLLKSN